MSFQAFANSALFAPRREPGPGTMMVTPGVINVEGTRRFTLVRACCVAGVPREANTELELDFKTFSSLKAAQRLGCCDWADGK